MASGRNSRKSSVGGHAQNRATCTLRRSALSCIAIVVMLACIATALHMVNFVSDDLRIGQAGVLPSTRRLRTPAQSLNLSTPRVLELDRYSQSFSKESSSSGISMVQQAGSLELGRQAAHPDGSKTGAKRGLVSSTQTLPVLRDVHVFYYMWYGTPQSDGKWSHWNHELIPHWNPKTAAKYPRGKHDPEQDDIGSTFWPQLGPYSSTDRHVVRTHMCQMHNASIGVAVLSWYPSGLKDDHGMHDHAELLRLLLDEAAACNVEVAIHIEPYKDRTPATVRQDLQFLITTFGKHPALHRRAPAGRHKNWLSSDRQQVGLPVIYVYDSYHNTAGAWAELLTPGGPLSIRGTDIDAILFCLWVEPQHGDYLAHGGFDGAYTYFAAQDFVYGSTSRNWQQMARYAAQHGTMFVPSVGPGYDDNKVRPWNRVNTRLRENGQYFDRMFEAALKVSPSIISITSWNEWHEGTNIEPAVSKPGSFKYDDYGAAGPNAYLNRVHSSVTQWSQIRFQER